MEKKMHFFYFLFFANKKQKALAKMKDCEKNQIIFGAKFMINSDLLSVYENLVHMLQKLFLIELKM